MVGAALGFTASPCGLGAVTLAGALRVRAPLVAAAFLCVAGIVDLRALQRASHGRPRHICLCVARYCPRHRSVVAWRLARPSRVCGRAGMLRLRGAPLRGKTPALCRGARAAPLLMLFGALVGAPPPQYHATETTLANLFAGEHLTFTGALARDAGTSAVVRYAITCCRADAAPVAVQLDRSCRIRQAPGCASTVESKASTATFDSFRRRWIALPRRPTHLFIVERRIRASCPAPKSFRCYEWPSGPPVTSYINGAPTARPGCRWDPRRRR